MQLIYSFLKKEARKKKLFNKSHSKKNRNYVIEKGMNYGEWCEPGRSAAESMKDGNYDVANAYFAYSGMLMSKIAKILDRPEAEVNELHAGIVVYIQAVRQAYQDKPQLKFCRFDQVKLVNHKIRQTLWRQHQ